MVRYGDGSATDSPNVLPRSPVVSSSRGRPPHHPKREMPMRVALTIGGLLFVFAGCVWFLQGINVLPGSYMTGQPKWAIYGAVLMIVGSVSLIRARRLRR